MGTEAIWIPLAMSALGAGANYYNQQQTAKKQDQTLAQQIRDQSAIQRQADARTGQMISQQARLTDQPQLQQQTAALTGQLKANQAQSVKPLQSAGAVSQAYQNAGADAAQGISNYGNTTAGLMAGMAAPTLERQANTVNIDNYANDLGALGRKLQGQNYLDTLKFQSIRQNPWIGLLGSGLQAGAGVYSGSSGSANFLAALKAAQAAKSGSYPYSGMDYSDLSADTSGLI